MHVLMCEHVASFYPGWRGEHVRGEHVTPLVSWLGGRAWQGVVPEEAYHIKKNKRYVQSEGLLVARWVVVLTLILLSRHAGFCM